MAGPEARGAEEAAKIAWRSAGSGNLRWKASPPGTVPAQAIPQVQRLGHQFLSRFREDHWRLDQARASSSIAASRWRGNSGAQ